MLIRTDSGGGTPDFLVWLSRPGRLLPYSIGFTLADDICEALFALPERFWRPAYDTDGEPRPGAWVTGLTGLLDLTGWPKGMRATNHQAKITKDRG